MTGRSIFFDFNLPNGTTWFYFSFLLAVALFFKFGRILSMRNWDVVTMFLLVPGFLLLQEAKPPASIWIDDGRVRHLEKNTPLAVASLVVAGLPGETGSLAALGVLAQADEPGLRASRLLWFGYIWLLCGSLYFFIRCLFDLALVSRPALAPNLSFGGLAWLAGALFICLVAVAYRPERTQGGQTPPPTKALPEKQNIPVGQQLTQQLTQQSFGYRLTARTFAVVCHLAVVLGLIFIGYRHFQDATAGMAAATFYLMLPYTGMHVGQADHVWPMVLVIWGIAAYRLPILAGILLGLAAVYAYFPALTFPIWLSFYWRRGALRFVTAFFIMVGVGLGLIGLALWQTDNTLAGIIRHALTLSAWQPWLVPTTEGFWTGVHWAYRIPVFIAYLAFVITTVCWPLPKNLAQVIALSAAVFIGIQFWYADQGGSYVLWYLPLLMLMTFRPNLSDRRPPPIQPDTDWLVRLRRALGRALARLVKVSEPMVRAH